MTRPVAVALATSFGVGRFPIAPGTAGSAAGLALWIALHRAGVVSVGGEVLLVVALLVIGAWAATETERALGVTDPGPVVIDEVMGMCATLVGAPISWSTLLVGFVLFRVFDVVKPPPARSLEKAHGGWGIMLDDLAAGLYAWAALRLWLLVAPAGL